MSDAPSNHVSHNTGNPAPESAAQRFLSVQRPAVLAHIRSMRHAHPYETPAQLLRRLENRYLAAVSTGGAAVGATAAIPVIGTGTALALSAAEQVVFLETTALYALSVAEVHGIAVDDPDRAHALVYGMMLGDNAEMVLAEIAAVALNNPTSTQAWGTLIGKKLPGRAIKTLASKLRKRLLASLAAKQGATILGRAAPFGVGAVIGGIGNNVLGRRVVKSSRLAFGPPPTEFPEWLSQLQIEASGPSTLERAKAGVEDIGHAAADGLGRAADNVARVAQGVGRAGGVVGEAAKDAMRGAFGRLRKDK
ncbi:hypothetical protein JT358_05210 [Micrococcales bacterium 31B]|nr:hypothetical protein [Micrococcales bacterium 31B]